jgi:hypothetical protein
VIDIVEGEGIMDDSEDSSEDSNGSIGDDDFVDSNGSSEDTSFGDSNDLSEDDSPEVSNESREEGPSTMDGGRGMSAGSI